MLPEGPRIRSFQIIVSKRLGQFISQALGLKGKVPQFVVTAHSTKSISDSWAICHQVLEAYICKAATWSSAHIFTKF